MSSTTCYIQTQCNISSMSLTGHATLLAITLTYTSTSPHSRHAHQSLDGLSINCSWAWWWVLLWAHQVYRTVLFFIQVYCQFASYFYRIAANKLISFSTKKAASSVERCWWTVCGPKYLVSKSYCRKNKLILIGEHSICLTSSKLFGTISLVNHYWTISAVKWHFTLM